MTHYLLSVFMGTDDPEPTPAEMESAYAGVDAFNDELKASGSWLFAGGLHPVDAATTVDGTGPDPVVTDGPFAESKEYLGGFWVIAADDLDAALAIATRASAACGGKVEVRPFAEDVS